MSFYGTLNDAVGVRELAGAAAAVVGLTFASTGQLPALTSGTAIAVAVAYGSIFVAGKVVDMTIAKV